MTVEYVTEISNFGLIPACKMPGLVICQNIYIKSFIK